MNDTSELDSALPVALTTEDFVFLIEHAPLVSIDLLVRDQFGRVLVGLRRNQPAKGYWFVPGGRVQKDERLEDAFRRITRAELGVSYNFHDATFRGLFEHFYATNAAERAGFGTHYIVLAYELSASPDSLSLPLEQHSEYQWLALNDLLVSNTVHDNTKGFFVGRRGTECQYGIVAARRDSLNELMWQSPVISLTAQAFLFSIVLGEAGPFPRMVAAFLSLITSLGSIQLMMKHRFNEEEDAKWLQAFEEINADAAFDVISKQRKPLKAKSKSWYHLLEFRFQSLGSYRVWVTILSLFLVTALGFFVGTAIEIARSGPKRAAEASNAQRIPPATVTPVKH